MAPDSDARNEASATNLFEQEVATCFSGLLTSLGFEGPHFSHHEDNLLGRVLKADYRSDRRKIAIRIIPGHPQEKPAFSMYLYRLPRKGLDDTMEMRLFTRKYRPDLDAALEGVRATSSTLETFIRSALPIGRTLLEDDAKEFVAGERWETGLYTPWT